MKCENILSYFKGFILRLNYEKYLILKIEDNFGE